MHISLIFTPFDHFQLCPALAMGFPDLRVCQTLRENLQKSIELLHQVYVMQMEEAKNASALEALAPEFDKSGKENILEIRCRSDIDQHRCIHITCISYIQAE